MTTEDVTYRGCAIVTISAAPVFETDESGAMAREALSEAGHHVIHQRWILDDLTNIRYLFREWVDDPRVDVVIAMGGTGLHSTDVTPEALGPLITKPMPGFGELYRALSFQEIGVTALETRAMAALCHSTLVYLIPGAPVAVDIAMQRLILPQLGGRLPKESLRPTMLPTIRKPSTREE